jgi:hypothetical protein
MISFGRPGAQKAALRLRNEQSLGAVCLAKLRDDFILAIGQPDPAPLPQTKALERSAP